MRSTKNLLILLFVTFAGHVFGQRVEQPVSEMRGVWIATVANIDWPSKPGLDDERIKSEFDSILDVLKALNLNAVFVQIRPAGDAFYRSPNIPWSKYLKGRQGVGPQDTLFDPLAYMIESAHKRRMEFHAWLNPYRATFDLDTASLSPKHPLRSLPPHRKKEWFFRYGKRYYFNPASAFVRQYLINVVKDVVLRYDVDGIHFDDYFYPYKEQGEELYDYDDFAADPRGFVNIEDWRRDNVNKLIESVHGSIKKLKPYVKFGIGPFGVWRNKDRDPINGSDTKAGITSYDDLYADVLLWLRNGWIDYVAPQLYWSIGFPPADYEKLVKWWSERTYGKQLYIGHAVYKVNSNNVDPNWTKDDEIVRQIALNRSTPNVKGSLFFSAKPLLQSPLGLQDSLQRSAYQSAALIPAMPSPSAVAPATAQICRVEGSPSAVKLTWHICAPLSSETAPYYFGIWRFEGEGLGNFKNPRNLIGITPFNDEKWVFEDQSVIEGEFYTYVVIAYNRLNMEGYSSEPVFVKKTKKTAKKKRKFWGYRF